MTDPHLTEPHVHTMDQFEDEVELMDYLKVLWKWKYLILAGTLICAIGAGIISLQMTKVYSVETVLQPGILKITDDGKTIYIDSANNIKALIDTNAVDGKLLKSINTPNKQDVPKKVKFKVTIPKGTNAVEVSYETAHVDIGLQILKNLNALLEERYGKMVRAYCEDYDMKIVIKKAEIANNKASLQTGKTTIQNIEKSMEGVRSRIKSVRENTVQLSKERDKFIATSADPENINILSSILYTNTIQQNMTLEKTYNDDLNNLVSRLEGLELNLEKIKNNIATVYIEIKSLEFKKNNIQNIQIIKQPGSSDSPVKPKMRLNILLAAVVGLFLTVFLAFFVEYISKYKAREQD